MDLGLAGKACLVSGASRGIGRAIALGLAAEGARVCGVARGAADLEVLAGELAAAGAGPHATVVADVATADGAQAAVDAAVAAFGGLDVVICNVGKSFARHADQMDDDDVTRSLDANLWTAVRVAQRAVPALRARGGGAIVLISSIWGREGGGSPGYNLAKAAVIAMGKALARDYAADGIRVNSVAPGSILFPGGGWARRVAADPDAMAAFVARELPFGRFGAPEEVADVVTFLASPRARWVSGACVVVDGCQSRAF
ncbi:MAG: SDR family oxidoreductase [Kofleriaceae bacterium]|nr:SDR family oxidoreductase [Kofleriaceae bacterium]MCB9571663.1 SDR family oxidoreductase [Kofleriaceae bacterium]